MPVALALLVLVAGAIGGAGAAALVARSRSERREGHMAAALAASAAAFAGTEASLGAARERVAALEGERSVTGARLLATERDLASTLATLEHERREAAGKIELVNQARSELVDTFSVLSAEALEHSTTQFLEMANATFGREQAAARERIGDIVTPIKESLDQVDTHVRTLERARSEAYGELRTQIDALNRSQHDLSSETRNLSQALRSPVVRGRWGELQLRRVVELAGMLDHCDFLEQQTLAGDAGRLRPDLVVHLPGGKRVVVDAKTPLQAYLDAVESSDATAERGHLRAHARHVRDHVAALSAKAYWEQFDGDTPDFVVLFLPGEAFFSAALQADPSLIELGAGAKVLLATPTTLIALLRTVAHGWQQERLAKNAAVVSATGRELYKRLQTLGEHLDALGSNLARAVTSYNKAVGSVESRVFVTARRFEELGVAESDALAVLTPVEVVPRSLQVPEFAGELGIASAGEVAAREIRPSRAGRGRQHGKPGEEAGGAGARTGEPA